MATIFFASGLLSVRDRMTLSVGSHTPFAPASKISISREKRSISLAASWPEAGDVPSLHDIIAIKRDEVGNQALLTLSWVGKTREEANPGRAEA